MQQTISNQQYDEERALYGLRNAEVLGCTFAGPADGESVLKECRSVRVHQCTFSLRYPLWHAKDFLLSDSTMDEATRAPIWYTEQGTVRNCHINGIKCLRECADTLVEDSVILSPEFGWKCQGVHIRNCRIESEYLFFDSRDVEISNLQMKGKYSFQYMENLSIENSILDTKDAFWHSKNVTVTNTTLRGEYLGWFSEDLTLVGCHIVGTQPLCYCKGLRLIDCTMEDTDLSFEYSEVDARIKGHIVSVKNPRSGKICADSIGAIISEGAVIQTDCTIEVGTVHKRNILL
ncbi:MAG: DUF3737 family protein [Ruminococcaceae bacterium]|nr:DUF3737 family protein [Oscillospiraceae bacterium]